MTCAIWVWSGAGKVTVPRDDAETLYTLCETALSADRTLGGLLSDDDLAQIESLSIREDLTKTGAVVRVAFVVAYSALLT